MPVYCRMICTEKIIDNQPIIGIEKGVYQNASFGALP